MRKLSIFLMLFGISLGLMRVPDALGIVKRVGTAGFTFLEIPATARQAALGEADVAIGEINTADGLFMNPALLGYITGKSASISYGTWIADMNHQSAAFAIGMGGAGTIGVSILRLDAGEFLGTTVDVNAIQGWHSTGTFNAGSYAIGPSYGLRMTDRFSFGMSVRYVRESVTGVKEVARGSEFAASDWLADIGTLYYTGFGSLRFATSIQSLGFDTQFEADPFQTPINYRLGAAYDFFDQPESPAKLTVLFEAIHPSDATEKVQVGGELWLKNIIALRAGYKFSYDEEDFTAGIGLKFDMGGGRPVGVDFAYADFGRFSSVTRFSFNIGF